MGNAWEWVEDWWTPDRSEYNLVTCFPCYVLVAINREPPSYASSAKVLIYRGHCCRPASTPSSPQATTAQYQHPETFLGVFLRFVVEYEVVLARTGVAAMPS